MARAMKDSDIEWIGEIPEGWQVSKVSIFFDIQLGKMLQPVQENESDTYEKYLCAANLGNNKLKMEPLKQMWFSKEDKEKFGVRCGDLLVVEGGDIASSDIIAEPVNNLYIQNALHRVRSRNGFDLRILRYYLSVAKASGHIDLICNKATIAHFTKDKFGALPYVVLPLEEQKQIADFLDAECARIDAVIEQTRASIEEYKKLKQSVITQAVTKGIRPGRKMKDSGVEWIGEIPEEWTVSTILSHITFEGGSQPPLTQFIHEPREGYVRLIQNRDYKTDAYITYVPVRSVSKFCEEDDVMIGRYGPPVFVLHRGIKGAYNVALMKAVPVDIDREFMAYVLQEYTLIKYVESFSKRAAGQDGVNPQILKKYPLCLPTRDEQIEIVTFLNEKCSDIDSIIAGKENLIDCLEQYKKSLVFEYVTGKKEVPA